VKSVFAGGVLHANTLMFESPEGLELITRHRATKAFISAAGVNVEFGVTCSNAYEREPKRVAIESAVEKILVADSSKFGMIRSDYFADLSDFDTVVTDSRLDPTHRDELERLGIRVYTA
jgi:DeoR family deoxyribose operon repressor